MNSHRVVINLIRLLAVSLLVVIISQCSVPRSIDSYKTAQRLAKSNAYQKAINDYRKNGLAHICLIPQWFDGNNYKVWCSKCFYKLDSTFVKFGITQRYRAVNLDSKNYNYRVLYWMEYKNVMDSLILAKYGPDFLDNLCATVPSSEKE